MDDIKDECAYPWEGINFPPNPKRGELFIKDKITHMWNKPKGSDAFQWIPVMFEVALGFAVVLRTKTHPDLYFGADQGQDVLPQYRWVQLFSNAKIFPDSESAKFVIDCTIKKKLYPFDATVVDQYMSASLLVLPVGPLTVTEESPGIIQWDFMDKVFK